MADDISQLSFEETQELCKQYRNDFNQVAVEMQPRIDAAAEIAENPNSSISESRLATYNGRELLQAAESRQSEIEEKMGPLAIQAHKTQNSRIGTAPGECTTEDLSRVTAPDILKP